MQNYWKLQLCLHLETYRLLLQHFLNFFFFPFVRTLSQDSRKSFMVGWTTCILKKSEFVFLLYLNYTKHVWKGSVLFLEEEIVCRTFPVLSLFLFIFKSLLFCLATKVWIFLLTCLLVFLGEYDHLPEVAFYMVGDISEAVAKAERLAEEVQ